MRPFTPAEVSFRHEVESFLSECDCLEDDLQYYRGRGGPVRRLYQQLGERGWLSLCWPTDIGGGGLPVTYEYLLWDALAYHRAARPDLGPGIVAHMIMRYGTAEQKDRYLPDLRLGRTSFSLGYSEPEAGSDLTGLRTTARRDGDAYRVHGEKCWTSDAHHADFLWLLCRTGEQEQRSRGLTLLMLDMTSAGVEVAPIPTIDGHRLNQVFLDGVTIAATDRIGPEGDAWTMIREALAVERHIQLLPGRLRRDLEDLTALVASLEGTVGTHRPTVADLTARLLQVEAGSLATLAALEAGQSGAVEAARAKLLGTALAQEIPRVALEIAGMHGLDATEPLPFLWAQSMMETIAGGTSEVMRSILAKEALGLGRTP